MFYAGLDLSMTSTGVCILSDKEEPQYFCICSKLSKKQQSFNHSRIHIIPFEKEIINQQDVFAIKEVKKTVNAYRIAQKIQDIIHIYCDGQVKCGIESVSFGSNGAVLDLQGLNYMVRSMLCDNDIPFLAITPTQNKSHAVGNGYALKDSMIDAWLRMDDEIREVDIDKLKIDDIADAYFLAQYVKHTDTISRTCN